MEAKTEYTPPGLRSSDVKASLAQLSGIERAAVLLIALGQDLSSTVMQQLTPDEIERLTSEILRMKRVDPSVTAQVIDECRNSLGESTNSGGIEYATSVLGQVFGEAKAREIIAKLSSGGGVGTLRWVKGVPPRQLAQAIRNERPQVIALIVGHLPGEMAAQVIMELPDVSRGPVVMALHSMQPTDPEVIRALNQIMLAKMANTESATYTEVGGNDSVVQILNNVDRSTERKILDYVGAANEEVAQQIKDCMFVFEDLLKLDNRAIQAILREVPQEDLRIALKGTDNSVRDIFYTNMSQRAAETLQEDLENSGPVRIRDVEAAQMRIVNIARQLDESGEISLRDSGEDTVS